MRYTDSQGLPYPATRREMANAPVASELLARAVDLKIQTDNAAWTAEMLGPTVLLTLSTNITGIGLNSDTPVFMDTVLQERPASWHTSTQTFAVREAGWYHCYAYLSVTCESSITVSSRRRLRVDVQGSADVLQPNLVTESYTVEEYERNGTTGLGVEFVTFLRPTYSVFGYFFHTNATSMRVNAAMSQFSFTKLCGEV
jgi:hypothetical protein